MDKFLKISTTTIKHIISKTIELDHHGWTKLPLIKLKKL